MPVRKEKNLSDRSPVGATSTAADTATTQSGPQLVLVSQVDVGGPAYAVTVQGDRAYVGAGNRLVVVDVSDPTAPHVVGQTEPFSDTTAPQVVGQTAPVPDAIWGVYVCNASAGIGEKPPMS